MQKMKIAAFPFVLLLVFSLAGCSQEILETPFSTYTVPAATSTPFIQSTATPSPAVTISPSQTGTATATITVTPSITPTYSILRGEVLERSNCRYGPGAVYLYKYGLVAGSILEVIGRNDLGTWILVRAIGGSNPCWLKASLMEIRGEVMSVAPVDSDIILPWSPFYSAPTGVSASRDGSVVTVSWHPLQLRAGDDSEQVPYVVAAWVCSNGQLTFTPVGSSTTSLTVIDEPGCSEQSHGRLYAAEKHGYTQWVKIPWPQLDPSSLPTSTASP